MSGALRLERIDVGVKRGEGQRKKDGFALIPHRITHSASISHPRQSKTLFNMHELWERSSLLKLRMRYFISFPDAVDLRCLTAVKRKKKKRPDPTTEHSAS